MRLSAASAALLLILASCSDAGSDRGSAPGAPPTATTTTSPSASTAPTATTTTPPSPEVDPIGSSIEGRPLQAVTFGSGITRVYVIGGMHGDERPAVENSAALLESLAAEPSPGVTVRWLIDANPDGSEAGTRENAGEVDLNRNWPTVDFIPAKVHGESPLSEPESAAVIADIARFRPDLIVTLHAAREGPFVNYDGPAEGEEAAAAFAAGASSLGRSWELLPVLAWDTPGSLGTYYGTVREIPVLTIEPSRWDHPASVRDELHAGLRSLFGFLTGDPAPPADVCEDHTIGRSCSERTRRIEEVAEAAGLSGLGFLVKEVEGQVLAARHADLLFYPASAVKVLHVVQVLSSDALDTAVPVHTDTCAAAGPATDVPMRDLIDRILIESDNAATNAVQDHFGTDALAAVIAAAGMSDTDLHHRFGCGGPANVPANHTTAADLVSLYESIATGALLPGTDLLNSMLDVTDQVLGSDQNGSRVVLKAGYYGGIRTVGGLAEITDGEGGTRRYAFAAFATGVTQPVGWIVDTLVEEVLRGLPLP